jgi:hypothetical protein
LSFWLELGIAVAIVLGFAIVLGTRRSSARLKRIETSRAGETFATFAAGFVSRQIPETVLYEVYGAVQRATNLPTFPGRSEDRFAEVYGIADDDLEALVLDLLKRLHCRIPGRLEEVIGRDVETVSDLVAYIDYLRPKTPSSAP